MRAGRLAVAGVLGVALMGGAGTEARAAECPSECRSEITMVPCSEEVVTMGDDVIRVVRRYWSTGAD